MRLLVILSFVWGIYLIQRFKKNYNLLSFLIGASFGIIIEVLQVTLTSYRSFDFFDIIANMMGLCLGLILVSILKNSIINLN